MKNTLRKSAAVLLAVMVLLSSAVTAFAFSSCTECGRIFENTADFNTHTKICNSDSPNKAITYYCGYCNAVFQTKALLAAHIEDCVLKPVIPAKGNNNSCPHCLEEFEVEAEFNNHIQLCREVFACSRCGLEFKSKSACSLHYIACLVTPTEIKIEVKIKNNPGSTEIKYGDVLVLTAETKNLPGGAYVAWAIDGDAATIEQTQLGETCKVTATGKGEVTVIARVVDKNGKPIKDLSGKEIYDSEVVVCKGGFIYKIISFFKDLFKADRTIPQFVF